MQAPDGTVTRTRYEPFGAYRGGSGGNAITDRGYTGHKQNDGLGLIYMNARFYVPDPASPQSYNRYSYVLNSPINFIDPSGHCANESNDAECWEEYDGVVNQFRSNNYTDEQILDLIGTGGNYTYKDKRIIEIYDRFVNCGSDFDCSNNASRSWDPYENTCGWQYWLDCYDPLLDYYTVSFSYSNIFPAGSINFIRDQEDNWYVGFSAQFSMPPGPGASASAGKVFENDGYGGLQPASPESVPGAISGLSQGSSGGYGPMFEANTTLSGSGDNNLLVDFGISTPQISFNMLSYTFMLYESGSSTPWIWQRE